MSTRDKTVKKMEQAGEASPTRVRELLGFLPESRGIPEKMPEAFRSALRRAVTVRRASLAAKRRSGGAGSFGKAVWAWLADSMDNPASALPDGIAAARLRSGELRAAGIGPEALAAICRRGQFEPAEFVALVAQDLEKDFKERIEQETFENRQQLDATIREYLGLLQQMQQQLHPAATAPTATAGRLDGLHVESLDPALFRSAGVAELDRYEPTLRRWARSQAPHLPEDDLVADTLLAAEPHLRNFEPRNEGSMLAFLRIILMNKIADAMRQARRRSDAPTIQPTEAPAPLSPDPVERVIASDREAYKRALSALPDRARLAVVLRLEGGASYEEIAAVIGAPTANAARMYVSRAFARLSEVME